MSEQQDRKGARRTGWKLAAVVLFMFGFGFALVPLYGAICRLTGLNGKGGANLQVAADAAPQVVDANRTIKVEFVTTVNGGRGWSFRPEQSAVEVHPGQMLTVYFDATNEQDQNVVGQARFSAAPWSAAGFVRKTECFCFRQQPFKAGEARRMPVRFTLDPALPADVDTVTFSYTLFDVTELAQHSAGNKPSS